MQVKFMWNGIKVDGVLYRGHYYCGAYTEQSGIPYGTITIYAKDYSVDFPEIDGLKIINESDGQTDYFEKDRIRVFPNNKYYEQVKAAFKKQNEHNEKRFAKRCA